MNRAPVASPGDQMGPAVGAAQSAQSAEQKTILIIDDDRESLRAMRLALAHETFRLETADTAESAFRQLSSLHPDLILLDSRISASDGTWLARRLLADEELAPIPIVALTETGTGTQGNLEPGGRFDGRIGKPVDAGTLPGQVRAFLESPGQAASHQPAGLPLPATPTDERPTQAAELLEAIEAGLPDSQSAPGTRTRLHLLAGVVEAPQHCELAGYLRQAERLTNAATARARSRFRSVIRLCCDLARRTPDVAPGLVDLRARYLDNRRAELSSLEHALKNEDFAALRKAGHNLKGMGAAYGFAELTDIGRALEAAAKDSDAAAIEVLLDQIDSYISMVRPSPE